MSALNRRDNFRWEIRLRLLQMLKIASDDFGRLLEPLPESELEDEIAELEDEIAFGRS